MRKQLLFTSAIALGVAAAPAMSQEWDVNIGGYYLSHLGFSDVSGNSFDPGGNLFGQDYDGVEIFQDAEVSVNPTITLDNGMTFGATIQYETGSSGRYTDEVYVTVSSDTFGTVDIGSENSAGYKLMWRAGAPSVGGVPINSGSVSGFVPFITSGSTIVNSFVGAGISQATEVGSTFYGNSDIQRISYYTPDFNGLTVGVSYAPDAAGADGANVLSDKNVGLTDIFDIGVHYGQTFGTTDISLAARWGTGDSNVLDPIIADGVTTTSDPETWGIAATATFGAISVGGHYAENDNGVSGGTFDEEGWGLGASYDAAGPWSFGIEYFYGEGKHGVAGAGTKDELQFIKLAANRNLGPGVNWGISLISTEVDAADAASGGLLGGDTGTDIEAITLASTISLSF